MLIVGSLREAAALGATGTLAPAIDGIFDQIGAMVVVIRVEEGADAAQTLANILGGVDAGTGDYTGVHALLASQSKLGVTPRILVAPGFTSSRVTDGVTDITMSVAGSGYISAPTVVLTGDGSGATATATLNDSGGIASVTVTTPGHGYSTPPTIAFTGGGGTGAAANATIGSAANPVVAEMLGIAERLRAVIIADGPNTNDTDAIDYRKDWSSNRVYIVDPAVLVSENDAVTTRPASPALPVSSQRWTIPKASGGRCRTRRSVALSGPSVR